MADLAMIRERLDAFVTPHLVPNSAPGIALALIDRGRMLLTANYGYANWDAKQPVTDETLFEIGSIGKSFTAIALLQLREEAKLDLHVPVTEYLPWCIIPTEYDPITIHHLLTHTAGIIRGTDFAPDARFEVWAARETETGCPPGERFAYSNLGYKILGLVLAEIEGKPYGEIIRERIFAPFGMTNSAGAITHDLRKRLAVGYTSPYDDRPIGPNDRLVPATWLETDTGDGCLAMNAADLATYLRMILNRGQGPAGRLLSEESFALLTKPVIEAEPGIHYAYGLGVGEKDGRPIVSHGGGMVGYVSDMTGDPELGVGVIGLWNGRVSYGDEIERYALALLRAWKQGEPLPEVPTLSDPLKIENAVDYAGMYQGDTRTLEVIADGERLTLAVAGERLPLQRIHGDTFRVDHPDFLLSALNFGRVDAKMVELTIGSRWYRNERYAGPTSFDCPEEWSAYPGHYRSHNPWISNFRVVPRKGQLYLVYGGVSETPLTPLGDGRFRVEDDPRSPERLAFDTIVDGVALRAMLSGAPYYRFFTP